ncbi:hypothetical protein Sa4125_29690 [Aureimonas sp. SA4125]|nr:hypothetical protein Sa4125_29690 [Aureimonas sp. SA4125]
MWEGRGGAVITRSAKIREAGRLKSRPLARVESANWLGIHTALAADSARASPDSQQREQETTERASGVIFHLESCPLGT